MHDCGHVINPMVVEGQIVGGVIHGVGNAFFERMVYDEQRAADLDPFRRLPPAACDRLAECRGAAHGDAVARSIRSGVKGAGEGGTIRGDRGAAVGAWRTRLEPFGVHIAEAPITPQRIVELLGDAALGRTR